MCEDTSGVNLATPLERNQPMWIPIELIPQEFIDLYWLQDKVNNGFCILWNIACCVQLFSEVGVLANRLAKERLEMHNYSEVQHTPGLSEQLTQPI